MTPYTALDDMPGSQREEIYSNIRESLFSGTYTTIRSRDGDLGSVTADRATPLRAVRSQRGSGRKVKTLTTLFEMHSRDVKKTLSEMSAMNSSGE
jgi:hypothetical protein